jgi:hypothetical protein
MFITSRNFSQLRELISLPTRQRNNPEVILVPCRKHPETIRRESNRCCAACGQRARLHLINRKTEKVLGQEDEAAPTLGQREEPETPSDGAGDGARSAAPDDDRLQATGKGPLAYPLFHRKMRMPRHAKPPTLRCRAFER